MLKFQAQSSDCLFNTTLRLATNASFFNIPLQCYDGSLDVSGCDQGWMYNTDEGMCRWMGGWRELAEWMDEWREGQMNEQLNGWLDRPMNGVHVHVCMDQ